MSDLLERMRRNPVGDWTIKDIENVCRAHGIACNPPSGGGSHYKVSHPKVREILTIPFRRRLKPIYIRQLVKFIEAVRGEDGRS